jgi:LytS/YehU family sensor histidine kinase
MAEAAAFHIDMINLAFIMSVAHLLLHLRDRQEKTLRAALLEAQLSEARMQTLQSQLQPHFLFNSLHTVGQLVRTQRSADAMKVVERLGDLLRTTLDERRPQLVTLADELRFARAYLEIEEIRFADRLRVDWQYEPAVECALVPPFLLQPLIENAVRHGIAPTASAGRLTISIDQRNGMLEIVVRDDGKGLRADLREGVGLRNTRERLETAFPGQAQLRIENAPGGGAEARVVIPFRTGPAQS